MESSDVLKLGTPFLASAAIIGLLSAVPLPLWILLPTIVAMTFVMQEQVFHTRLLARSFWLTTYLRPDSSIRTLLTGSRIIRGLAVGLSIPLSIATYISLYSYGLLDCVAVAIGISVARIVHHGISSPIDAHLSEHLTELAHLRIHNWLAVLAVLLCLAMCSLAKGLRSDYSKATSDQLATFVIEEVKHPVPFVQHCVRTLRYSELQLLRVRDIVGWPYGWLMYLFFLVPNAIPAFGLVTLFAGAERVVRDPEND